MAADCPPSSVAVLTAVTVLVLAVQPMWIRPGLDRRSDQVPAGENLPRSRARLLSMATGAIKARPVGCQFGRRVPW